MNLTRKYMRRKKIKVKDLAESLAYTPTHMSYILNGKRNLNERMKMDLIIYFTCSFDKSPDISDSEKERILEEINDYANRPFVETKTRSSSEK